MTCRQKKDLTEVNDRKYCPECFESFSPSVSHCPSHNEELITLPSEESLVGSEVDGKYRVLEQLGRGGMGTVYRVKQKLINREVALKVLRSDFARNLNAAKRFFVEARAASQLRCRNSVLLYDFGLSRENLLFYTMELLEGQSLASLLKGSGPIPFQRAIRIAMDVCRSLEEAHGKGIVHRDLKPDNIMLVEEDSEELAKVLDFGIAKLLTKDDDDTTLTVTGMVCGTPEYMSPEQATGRPLGPAADLYSLGILLYEMVAGKPPFKADTPVLVLMKHVNDIPEPVRNAAAAADIPEALEELLVRLLAKDQAERPSDAAEVRKELVAIEDGKSGTGETALYTPDMLTPAAPPKSEEPPEPEQSPQTVQTPETEAPTEPQRRKAPQQAAPTRWTEPPLQSGKRKAALYGLAGLAALALLGALVLWGPLGTDSAKTVGEQTEDLGRGSAQAPDRAKEAEHPVEVSPTPAAALDVATAADVLRLPAPQPADAGTSPAHEVKTTVAEFPSPPKPDLRAAPDPADITASPAAPEIKQEIKPEIRQEIRRELTPELTPELKPASLPEPTTEPPPTVPPTQVDTEEQAAQEAEQERKARRERARKWVARGKEAMAAEDWDKALRLFNKARRLGADKKAVDALIRKCQKKKDPFGEDDIL